MTGTRHAYMSCGATCAAARPFDTTCGLLRVRAPAARIFLYTTLQQPPAPCSRFASELLKRLLEFVQLVEGFQGRHLREIELPQPLQDGV